MDPQNPAAAKQDGNDNTTRLHHPYILCHFANFAFVLVSCVHNRVVEGVWEGIAGSVVHVDLKKEDAYNSFAVMQPSTHVQLLRYYRPSIQNFSGTSLCRL